ncbi:MAG: Rieske 2Fe-2S domain-containing protein [Actinobacteria bacterium]|nr:Rieske 2Fe-2S domain-containing protein [Actinomycetota bacterium]
MAELVTVGRSDEIGEGKTKAFQVGAQLVGIARVGGELLAFSDICTHRQCNLTSGGEIEGTVIDCECHGSRFDMKTGEVVEGPATEPLATFEVTEENGEIQVNA